MSEDKEWGGKREGAGRKPSGSPHMLRKTVSLPPEVIEQLQQLGDGNLSAGIRAAAARLFGKAEEDITLNGTRT